MSKNLPPEKIKNLFAGSVQKLQQGDALGARKGLEKVVKAIPGSVAVWYNLALSYQYLNSHAKAAEAYRKVIRLEPGNADAVINLGLSQKELKQTSEAMQSAKSALDIVPDHPRALNLVGTLYAEQNEFDEAGKALKRALEIEPDNIDARHNLANLMMQSGDSEAALEIARPLLETGNPELRNRVLVGQILLDLKRFGDVSGIVEELKAEFAGDEGVMLLDMSLCEMVKDYFAVIDVAREILEKMPDYARVWNSLGSAYFQLDSISKAADCYRKAIELDLDHPQYQNNMGLAYSSSGEKSKAESCYRRAIELNPGFAEAYRNLVAMKKFSSMDDEDARAIERLWQSDEQDDFHRTKLAFALGKVYDDVGEFERAFATYEVGNRLKFAEASLDFDQYLSHIDGVLEVFTERPLQLSEAIVDRHPVFILGMPRSGTTLVEQIISRHPAVTGCGELPCIEKAIAHMEKQADPMRVYPRDFLQIGVETLTRETLEYLSWVERLHDLQTDYFTDKMPFNFVHVWLIKALFPDAGIVHCHRHPLDVIASNYFQLYASDISFVYDLEVLARYYARYHRLMRHWHRVFGGDIHQVRYEALVGSKEAETRKLIKGAKLPWDEACLDPEKSDTAVRTASIWQVRQGIYTTSRGRWRHYERQLRPAIEILQAEKVIDAELNYIE